jgi:phage shock protein A
MGIFTRFRDIISSNINAMLDRAEDPEKLIKLMIREMEDTLVEIKAACAGAMASSKKVQRRLQALDDKSGYWETKAELAVKKDRDDLAREALVDAVTPAEPRSLKMSCRNMISSSSNIRMTFGSLKKN